MNVFNPYPHMVMLDIMKVTGSGNDKKKEYDSIAIPAKKEGKLPDGWTITPQCYGLHPKLRLTAPEKVATETVKNKETETETASNSGSEHKPKNDSQKQK